MMYKNFAYRKLLTETPKLNDNYLKLVFSKKATKIDEIFTVHMTLTYGVKIDVKISSIFMAFLENVNFTKFLFTELKK